MEYGSETLRHLNLTNCALRSKHFEIISRFLGSGQALESLWLGENEITTESLFLLSGSLRKNTSLRTLGISDAGGYAEEAMLDLVANAIGKLNRTLTCLDFSRNSLSKQLMDSMGQMLLQNHSIRALDLSGIYRFSADSFAEGSAWDRALRSPDCSLRDLNLSFNSMSYELAAPLLRALSDNRSLRSLNIKENSFGDKGLSELATRCIACEECSVSQLNIFQDMEAYGEEAVALLRDAMEKNRSIDTIYSSICDQDGEKIEFFANRNSQRKQKMKASYLSLIEQIWVLGA